MEEFKKCPVVMLPTSGTSVIGLDEGGKPMFSKELGFGDGLFDVKNNFKHRPQHIYIASTDEIKEGDWVLSKLNELVLLKKNYTNFNYKKIIATTDPKLELPKLTDLLLTDFHINGVPKEIMVKYNGGQPVFETDLKNIITQPVQTTWNYDDIRLIATRFAHQCRLKGITTNNDTVNLFDDWAQNNIYFKP